MAGRGIATACVLLLFLAACASPSAPPYRPVSDVKDLMKSVIDPQADVFWESVKTTITAAGIDEKAPRTAAEWTAVRNAAVILAESGNLLMMAPRAKDGGDWMRYSRELVEVSQRAIAAADARDPKRVYDVGGEINDTCMQCHEHYDPTVRRDLGKPPL